MRRMFQACMAFQLAFLMLLVYMKSKYLDQGGERYGMDTGINSMELQLNASDPNYGNTFRGPTQDEELPPRPELNFEDQQREEIIKKELGTAEQLVQTDELKHSDTGPQLKRILYWTPYWDHHDYRFGMGRQPFVDAKCQVDLCEVTNARSMLDESDAVIVHANNVFNLADDIPPRRLNEQLWVFFNMEPPSLTRVDLTQLNGLFNWTMTYRADSDIPTPWGKLVPLTEKEKEEYTANESHNYAAGRTKLVAWFTSHCPVESGRDWFTQELQKYIPVDVFGLCGPLECGGTACNRMVRKDYKFYMAFENSLCDYYISEKLWRAIFLNVIPIVIGAGQYSTFLPEHSYIDVKDFSSMKDLADYLVKLDNDEALYNEYFKWHADYKVIFPYPISHSFCELCAKLHEGAQPKTIPDLFGWYSGEGVCKKAVEFYGHVEGFPQEDPIEWGARNLERNTLNTTELPIHQILTVGEVTATEETGAPEPDGVQEELPPVDPVNEGENAEPAAAVENVENAGMMPFGNEGTQEQPPQEPTNIEGAEGSENTMNTTRYVSYAEQMRGTNPESDLNTNSADNVNEPPVAESIPDVGPPEDFAPVENAAVEPNPPGALEPLGTPLTDPGINTQEIVPIAEPNLEGIAPPVEPNPAESNIDGMAPPVEPVVEEIPQPVDQNVADLNLEGIAPPVEPVVEEIPQPDDQNVADPNMEGIAPLVEPGAEEMAQPVESNPAEPTIDGIAPPVEPAVEEIPQPVDQNVADPNLEGIAPPVEPVVEEIPQPDDQNVADPNLEGIAPPVEPAEEEVPPPADFNLGEQLGEGVVPEPVPDIVEVAPPIEPAVEEIPPPADPNVDEMNPDPVPNAEEIVPPPPESNIEGLPAGDGDPSYIEGVQPDAEQGIADTSNVEQNPPGSALDAMGNPLPADVGSQAGVGIGFDGEPIVEGMGSPSQDEAAGDLNPLAESINPPVENTNVGGLEPVPGGSVYGFGSAPESSEFSNFPAGPVGPQDGLNPNDDTDLGQLSSLGESSLDTGNDVYGEPS